MRFRVGWWGRVSRLFFFWVVVSVLSGVHPVFARDVQTPSLPSAPTGQPIVAIEIVGNMQIPESTYRYYIQTKEGDLYEPELCLRDFERLWGSRLLEDLRVEVERAENGVKLRYVLKERPIIEKVEWPEKFPHLNKDDVTERLQEENAALFDGEAYDPYMVFKAKKAIQKLYAEKGYRFATVIPKIETIGPGRIKILWTIDPGENLRVGRIIFDGNRDFPDKTLRDHLKHVKVTTLWSSIFGKNKYDPEKLKEDLEKLREFYYDRGYLDVRIGDPHVEIIEGRSIWSGKPTKQLKLVIPIFEGPRYKVADIRFEGAKVFSDEELMKMLDIRPGEWFSNKKVNQSLQWILEAYGDRGYIFANVVPEPVPRTDSDETAVDLIFRVREHKPQVIRRIEFVGNTYTYDDVIRRELEIQEYDVVNAKMLRRSLQKLFRLGYFDNVEPEIKPVEGRDDMIDLIIKVSENRRNQIQAGGGYSELEGLFGSFAFSTRNLFGTGKSLGFSTQIGKRIQTYSISLVDPYFFGTDWYVGLDLFNTWSNLFIYEQRNRGGGLTLGHRIKGDWNFRVSYRYSQVRIDNIDQRLLSSRSINPIFRNVDALSRIDSRITPQVIYNTLNDPIDPSEGSMFVVALGYAGGFLGGNVKIFKPIVQYTRYFTINRKGHRFAFNVEAGGVFTHGGGEVPFYERFFLGGDLTIRGYDFRTIGPIDPQVSRVFTVGGERYALFNVEYIIPIKKSPAQLIFFTDGGNAYAAGEVIDPTEFRFSSGFEFRIIIPALQTPLRLIFARNWNRGPVLADAWAFRFGIGRSF